MNFFAEFVCVELFLVENAVPILIIFMIFF